MLTTRGLRPICWDEAAGCVAFTDGACRGNGRAGARAAFAAVITGGHFGRVILRGEVAPVAYELVDEGAPERGLRPAAAGVAPVAPSNNRGELLGVACALLALLRGRAAGRVELVSDSLLCIRTLLEWYPARLAAGTERELKNLDLLRVAWGLLGALRARAAVTLTHVRSHRPAPAAQAPAREHFLHRGNELADLHAGAPLAAGRGPPRYDVEILEAPPALCTLAPL
jgi:ribonuclease HI